MNPNEAPEPTPDLMPLTRAHLIDAISTGVFKGMIAFSVLSGLAWFLLMQLIFS